MGTGIQAPAMLLWVTSGVALVVAAGDPYTSLAVTAASAAVAAGRPRSRSFGMLVGIGVFALVLRTALFAVTGHEGQQVLFVLPAVRLPAFAGGAVLGGAVKAEVVAVSLKEGADLVAITALVGAFLSVTPASALLRLVPRFLFDAGLVVTVALAFVPQAIRSARDIREAQLARGLGRGLAGLRDLFLPVIATALDRSITLAESMDSRGYGRTSGAARTEAGWRALAVAAAATTSVFGLLAAMGRAPATTVSLSAAGAGVLAICLAKLSKLVPRTRFAAPKWAPADLAVAVASIAAAAAVMGLAAGRPADLWPPPAGSPAIALVLALPSVIRMRRNAAGTAS